MPTVTSTSPPRETRRASRPFIDDRTIAIPERPGNERADGYLNLLARPRVGTLFVVPGRGDTLRINGRATVLADADYFDTMSVGGKRPILALEVDVEEVFFHCAKAFLARTRGRRNLEPRPRCPASHNWRRRYAPA